MGGPGGHIVNTINLWLKGCSYCTAMSTTVESDSIYEAYDPTLVYLNAEQVKEVSNGPAVSSQNSAYLAPVSKQDTVVTHSQPQSPGNDYGMLSNVRTEFFRIDTRYLRSLEGIMRFVSLVSDVGIYLVHTHACFLSRILP